MSAADLSGWVLVFKAGTARLVTAVSRILSLLALGLLFGLSIHTIQFVSNNPRHVSSQDELTRATERIKSHLVHAEEKCDRATEMQLVAVAEFFGEAKNNTPAFAKIALSGTSKLKYVIGFGGRFDKYIRRSFEKHIFSPPQLQQAVHGEFLKVLPVMNT